MLPGWDFDTGKEGQQNKRDTVKDTGNISLDAMRTVKPFEWMESGQTKSKRNNALSFFEEAVHFAEFSMRVSLPTIIS